MTVLVVSGTGTGVGKTVVTAGLAALAVAGGRRVAVLKPAQTGVGPGEPGDLDDVRRLVGQTDRLTLRELVRYPDPLAPLTAAARCGRPPLDPAEAADAAAKLAVDHDLVLVEGAGGLLVRFTEAGTLADVAAALDAPVLVVTAAGLGTLNHTELTVEALRTRGLRCAGLVIGSWPTSPDLAAECNLDDLPEVTGAALLGRMPADAGRLEPDEFLATARGLLRADAGVPS
ncbi:dethiobiotin synthase [Pseudonocardia eucalypti]|uniref:ATP-dependent dethiobiotin synthetase BioD n=1 Tax=Pseudonocardia eucalypti TaxID=648755 RepID=A0ABP9QVD9_9PSEU|nr:dethiobiotin synthetase [Pseudonocardia eucalypti]